MTMPAIFARSTLARNSVLALLALALLLGLTEALSEYRNTQLAMISYELCAVFAHASQQEPANAVADSWAHPAGRQCFPLDVVATTQYPVQTMY